MFMIRKLVVSAWEPRVLAAKNFSEAFEELDRLGAINSLVVKVDETAVLKAVFEKHPSIQWHHSLGDGPQVHLEMFWAPGIFKLRGLEQVHHIEFASPTPEGSALVPGGIIPGGVLEPIQCEMNAKRSKR